MNFSDIDLHHYKPKENIRWRYGHDTAFQVFPFNMKTRRSADDDVGNLDSVGVLMVKKKANSFFYRLYQGFNTLTVTV